MVEKRRKIRLIHPAVELQKMKHYLKRSVGNAACVMGGAIKRWAEI
jgi:hypothetical protein